MKNKEELRSILFWCMSFIIKKYFIYVFLFLILVFIQQYCILLVPRYIQNFIDVVSSEKTQEISQLFTNLLLTVVLSVITRPLFMLSKMVFCEKGICDIQYSVVSKARSLGYDYFENTPRGQMLAETYQNVLSIYSIYDESFPRITVGLFAFVVATGKIMKVSPLLFNLLLIACYVIISSVVIISKKKVFQAGEELAHKNNKFYRQNYDLVDSREEVLASHAQAWFLSRINDALVEMQKMQRRKLLTQNKYSVILDFLQIAVIICFFVLAIYIVGSSVFSVGEIVAIFLYLTTSIASLIRVVKLFIDLAAQLASIEKPYHFFKLSPTIVEKKDAINSEISGDVSFQNVSFSYGDHEVLKDLNIKIKKGEHVVIVGESGSGKTTLLKLLLRYYDINNGVLSLDKIPIDEYSLSTLRDHLGMVFQETFFFTGNLWDNLEFAQPNATEDQIRRAVELACMDSVFDTKEALAKKELTNRGENLSGGERQRLSIARMFLKNPNIVLLDEATSALDYATEARVLQNLFHFFEGKTLIMVSHRLSAINKFDRILVVKDGTIVQDGDFDEVSKKGSYFSSLINKGLIINS